MTSHSASSYSYSSKSTTGGGGGGGLSTYSYGDKDAGNSSKDKVVVKNSDMEDDMKEEATKITQEAFDQFKVEKDIAAYIKKEFDSKFGAAWHCIVGRNFGSYVTHETRNFIYMYVKQVAVLLFKSG